MKLLTEIDPHSHLLPDHIEIGVRVWQLKLHDARTLQPTAAVNSAVVRNNRDAGLRWLAGTETYAAEQYAYIRWLMGIDDYWLSTKKTIRRRWDYELLLEHQAGPDAAERARVQAIQAGAEP